MSFCNCKETCGDDGDIDGPGTCKALPIPNAPALIELILVRRRPKPGRCAEHGYEGDGVCDACRSLHDGAMEAVYGE